MGWLDSGGGDGWDLLTPEQQNDVLEDESMERDERWEKVSAQVGDYVWPYEDEAVVPFDPVLEFLIEVVYVNTVWYNRILVSKEELKVFPELYQKTLDKMVAGIDKMLDEREAGLHGKA